MNLISIYRKRKGVSPVIAVVLLIALTVAAAGIIYFIVTDLLQPTGSLDFQREVDTSATAVKLEFKANQDSVILNGYTITDSTGTNVTGVIVTLSTSTTTVENNGLVTITFTGTFTVGAQYTFEIEYEASGSTRYTTVDVTV